jgi:transposase InsO family protein
MAREKLYRLLKQKARGLKDRDARVRLELILLALKLGSVSEACARRGFSRRCYYRWWRRLKRSQWDLSALQARSRRPKRSPRRVAPEIERRIVWYRRRDFGSRMIEAFLKREGIQVSRSTISHVLRRRRPARPLRAREKLKAHRKRYELPIPGQRLQIDVKYVPCLIGGRKAYAYVAVDECTRWRYAHAFDQLCEGSTALFLEKLVQVAPFPIHTIQTDNGQEFTYALNPVAQHLEKEHSLYRFCQRHGIRHRRIPPGVKELNGKVERSHRTDEQYFYWQAPDVSLERFNSAFHRWMERYNRKRPHGGLGYLTPWETLEERLKNLPAETVVPELEPLRLKFLAECPKRLSHQDRHTQVLERQLRSLLNAA